MTRRHWLTLSFAYFAVAVLGFVAGLVVAGS